MTIVGLFIPVYHRECKVRRCFDMLCSTLIQDADVELHVRVGFNGGPPSLLEYLTSGVPTTWCDTYAVFNPGSNIGKGAIVNAMVSDVTNRTRIDYVVSLDSDMIVRHPRWIRNFVDDYELCPIWKDLGGLSAQQDGECCHVLTNDPKIFPSYMCGVSYTVVPKNEGVAGGALLTPYHIWRTLGGYRAHRIYASDDADYMLACAKHGLVVPVVNDKGVVVFHPSDDEPSYRDWKIRAAREKLNQSEEKGFYESKEVYGQ